MAEYEVLHVYMIANEDKIAKGEEILFMVINLDNGSQYPVKAKVAKSKTEMPQGADLWVRHDQLGGYLNKEPWAIQIVEEYDYDSEAGKKILALGKEYPHAATGPE